VTVGDLTTVRWWRRPERRRRHGIALYLLRRVALTIATVWALISLVFLMFQTIPGDPARVAAGEYATPAQVEQVRARLGLDHSLPYQYVRYFRQIARGDLGTSTVTFKPVLSDLRAVLPGTLELVVATLLISLLVAVPLGVVAAARGGRAVDSASRVGAVVAGSAPPFWLALMAQYLLARDLHLFPISGQLSFGNDVPSRTGVVTLDAVLTGDPSALWDALLHLCLPVAVLALHFGAQFFRAQRTALLSELQRDYVATAVAKGASPRRVVWRHAAPNSIGPVVGLAGLQIGGIVGMAVLVEIVFVRQGVGSYLAAGVAQKDTYAVLGAVLCIGLAICVANLVADLLQLLVNPKVRRAELGGTSA
jgi:peptide/nickel transport system permease protein